MYWGLGKKIKRSNNVLGKNVICEIVECVRGTSWHKYSFFMYVDLMRVPCRNFPLQEIQACQII